MKLDRRRKGENMMDILERTAGYLGWTSIMILMIGLPVIR